MSWPFRLAPAPDELLSGYLCRIARAHGSQPHAFCALHFGADEFWSRDPDRGAIGRLMQAVSKQSALPMATVSGMSLAPWIERLLPARYRRAAVPACVPWINAVGVFHRTRTLHGLQFCPQCIAERPIVARSWRLACVAVCERHGCLLHDACGACDAPFLPHRAVRGIDWCHRCGRPLSQAPTSIADATFDEIVGFQRAALDELSRLSDASSKPGQARRLLGLRVIVSAAMIGRSWPAAASLLGLDSDAWGPGRAMLEKSRSAQRVPVLVACARIAAQPEQWVRLLATRLRWTRKTFVPWQPLPPWLQAALDDLPDGIGRHRPQRGSIAARIERLARERPHDWRSQRARLLMLAAGTRQ